jgi:N-methylhydantoinase A
VVVPRVASGFCAFGAAISEVRQDFVSTYTVALDEASQPEHLQRINEMLESMEQRGRGELAKDGVDPASIEVRHSFEMRYTDQVHNCLVHFDFAGAISPDELIGLRQAFELRHKGLYTYSEPENTALLVNMYVSVIGNALSSQANDVFEPALGDVRPPDADTSREVYLGSRGTRVTALVVGVDGVASAPDGVAGPAIIEETTTTIAVPEGWTAFLDTRGHYEIRRTRTSA